ncbi:tudor and KH domain-containing protein isoform X2 [Spea bombifrons]|nr:tudor and KH domain-containing protein isoform X2 [Spea bombifrons]
MSATSWNNLSAGQKVAVAVGISAGAAMLCVCYARYRGGRVPGKSLPADGENVKHRMKVPRDALKLLVGKEGAIRKRLRKQTDARIEVGRGPDEGGECELLIAGSAAQVYQAKEAVHGILQNAVLSVELQLPSRCMPRIIGQGGDRIRAISKSSGAKIQCEQKHGDADVAPTRRIIVSGTKEQVEAAKILIQKVSEEEENLQQRAAKSSAFRCRRKEIIAVKKKDGREAADERAAGQNDRKPGQDKEVAATRNDGSQEQRKLSQEDITDATYNVPRFEVPSPDFTFSADEYVDVYVSAMENPEHFWIQILGSRSSQLDKLTTEMTEHYQKQQSSVADIQAGDIVAAPFHADKFWYRAKVLGFLENGNVDLYYVDYGDNWATAVENVCPLRSDFLSLPFQAIECSLVGIASLDGQWSETALDVFESLTYCAQWKPLLAKISSFPSPGVSPCFLVRLYDLSTEPIVDIGQQLISQGLATERKDSPLQADEEENLVSRLMDEVSNCSMGPESFSFASHQEEQLLAS